MASASVMPKTSAATPVTWGIRYQRAKVRAVVAGSSAIS